jgi:hypothetical protein
MSLKVWSAEVRIARTAVGTDEIRGAHKHFTFSEEGSEGKRQTESKNQSRRED